MITMQFWESWNYRFKYVELKGGSSEAKPLEENKYGLK